MGSLFSILKQTTLVITTSVMLGGHLPKAIAGDPFRQTDARAISDQTESVFEAMFMAGDYQQAATMLADINENADPLAYALKASIAYTEQDWNGLKTAAQQTLRAAEPLEQSDPLRHNLYLAVGHFLEGTYLFQRKDSFRVFQKLQTVFRYLDQAENHNPDDPELNVIKGYLDLMLAVNLPFFQTEQAIARFETHARPSYLVNRGLAIAYRDLEEYEKAQTAVNKAINATPNNPEIHYLKGQILYNLGDEKQNIGLVEQAVTHFERAIAGSDQLPHRITQSYQRERDLAQELLQELKTAKR